MQNTHHWIEVEAEPERAFSLSAEVEKWPGLFPPCKSARVLERQGHRQRVEVTALAQGTVLTWQSERELHPESRTITFQQVSPSPLLRRMEGTWRFFPLANGTLVTLEHRFEVKDQPEGLVEGVSTREEAIAFMLRTIDENSERELQAIKNILEAVPETAGAPRAEFEESLFIASPAEEVYPLLHRASEWPQLLPHCGAVEMKYDDGRNQEFVMTVEVRGAKERIRTIRRCTPHSLIRYFQPEPPPVLRQHTGEWRVEPAPGGVRVISWHAVVLRPEGVREQWGDLAPEEALERVMNAINANSYATLLAIKSHVEKREEA